MSASSGLPTRLFLVRHAAAAWPQPGECDFDRTLSEAGLEEARKLGAEAMRLQYVPDSIISSSALRCRQTTEILVETMGADTKVRLTDTLYECGADVYLDLIGSADPESALMIVGHNPTLEDVAAELCGAAALSEHAPLGLPTAGFLVLAPAPKTAGHRWQIADFLSGGI